MKVSQVALSRSLAACASGAFLMVCTCCISRSQYNRSSDFFARTLDSTPAAAGSARWAALELPRATSHCWRSCADGARR
uniref:Putative secreted protein n=1 Tax=Ixodes ricinus TaxID=34613 RepID=A0A6B0TXG7_IXORI